MRTNKDFSLSPIPYSLSSGFTLIELLVVIFIIGILAGVLFPNFIGSRQRARDARRKNDLSEVKGALGLYYNDNQSYPSAANLPFDAAWSSGNIVYMNHVPEDPLAPDQTYDYCVDGTGDWFLLCAQLENEGDGDAADSASNCGTPCTCDCTGTCYYVCN